MIKSNIKFNCINILNVNMSVRAKGKGINRLPKKKGTLDQKHTEKISKLKKGRDSLPEKKILLKKYINELEILNSLDPNKYTTDDIRKKAFLKDEISNIENEISRITNCVEDLDYLTNTLPILIDYYDNKDIINDNEEDTSEDEKQIGNKRNILSYFTQEKSNKEVVIDNSEKKNKISKAKLYDNYLSIIDSEYRQKETKKTSQCNINGCTGYKLVSHIDGMLICNICGSSEEILISTEKPNYREPTQDTSTYAYKRINHLTEILSQLQAKESTDIPPEIYEAINRDLKKRKISKDTLDMFKLRKILKKLKLNKYYEHVPHILQVINKKEPPNFSREDEQKIKNMFKDIQKPFSMFCPENRKNFLNYAYVLRKFCELLGLDDYINYFPLLKNNNKLREHDKIWGKICEYMKWKFYRSI